MTRRILTARDQVALLAPWREAASKSLRIERHEPGRAPQLAQEILDQDGPLTLFNLFEETHPASHLYVARGDNDVIHAAAEVHHDDKNGNTDIHSIASSLKAPPGTGLTLLQPVAQEALKRGHNLFALDSLPHARNYWESVGGQFDPDEFNDAMWSKKSLQGLAEGTPVPARHTLMYDDDRDEFVEPPTTSSISREHRLPGSARKYKEPSS